MRRRQSRSTATNSAAGEYPPLHYPASREFGCHDHFPATVDAAVEVSVLLLVMSNTDSADNCISDARKISVLRQRMIDDMTVRNFAPNTMRAYVKQVSYFAQHFGRSPVQLGPEDIRRYQVYLVKERKVAVNSRTVAVSALRFLYHVTLKQNQVIETIPYPKKEDRLPVILSPEEVLRLLEAA